ncbi:hypothetical protein N0V93_009457 [Gnomoniopsis smithogilvyi]|uniref:Phenylacetyl-CoA ligase n=1 Tax=Gnomoniopsis smithogilvyi TaxID=1191159 RepID=A0A9W8YKT4_9PEZI|nr:hypothetical protein N0V93_009457 [Gnomoniopsis smithogilvyi]
MVFHPPAWVPKLPFDPPDSITIADFITKPAHGRHPIDKSRNPFTCGITGKTFTLAQFSSRYDSLARAVGKRLEWQVNEETEWDKVACIFSFNTIDYVTVAYAIHRLNGIVTPANAAYSVPELTHQLKSSGAKALFVGVPQLQVGLEAAKAAGLANDKIWIMGMPGFEAADGFVSVEDLIAEGTKLPQLDALRWTRGQGARQVAFLCYSSGTSGLPKAVMISHVNIIANSMQYAVHETYGRKKFSVDTQSVLGLLPFSHIYGLVVVAHGNVWRGDEVVVLPKFEMPTFLKAIERFKLSQLYLVPPIVIRMTRSPDECKKYNLESIRVIFSGAAPLGEETVQDMVKLFPNLRVAQGYGMTELATIVISTSEHDILNKSSGSLCPATKAKVVGLDGKEITKYDAPGELWIQSPSAALGYLNNQKATAETFAHDEGGRWVKTGDEAVVTLAPSGNEHIVIVDRIKELIKVKGHQVAPAELEAHLLSHPAVGDCAVIQIPDDRSGEVPKAFVAKAVAFANKPEEEVVRSILKHVEEHKAPYKWIKGGVEFVDEIPKSPSGKILRRLLRDKEKASRTQKGAKL